MARPDEHIIARRPEEGWDGLDLRTTVFNIDGESAREANNVDITQSSGSLISRPGYKGAISNSGGGYGLLKYTYLDSSTGQNVVEELVVKDNLYKIASDTFTITYLDLDAESSLRAAMSTRERGVILPSPTDEIDSGDMGVGISTYYIPGLTNVDIPFVYANHLVTSEDGVTGTWLFELYVDSEQVLAFTTSVGFDEDDIPTLADLKTAIDAIPGFFATIGSGLDSSLPAAMAIPSLAAEPFSSLTLAITCEYDTILNKPGGVTTTFSGTVAAKNSEHFENATSYNVNSVIYINTGYDAQKKYDGQKVYNSGLPAPASTFAAVVGAAGNVNTGDHIYTAFYRQRDAQGNICEGDESAEVTVSPGTGSIINLTIPNIQSTTGYNTDQAIVSGNQTGVTTITTNTHSLKVGDPITFINRSGGALVTDRTVTAKTATSITISGSAVNVNNTDIISAGLTIQICRTKVGDTTPYLVYELPNNSASATQSYADNVADSTLSTVFERPPIGFEHGIPPACRYGVMFSGIPILTGALTNGDAVYYADTTNPEHFPALNSFNIRGTDQDVNTGLHASQEYLLVFKSRSTYLVSGDIANDDFIVQERTMQVGCAAHASIVQLPDGSVAFMSFKGPQRLAGSGEPDDIGYNILPLFLAMRPDEQTLQLKRTVAISDIKKQKVLFFVPCESTTGSDRAANTNSITLMLDTQHTPRTRLLRAVEQGSNSVNSGTAPIGTWYLWNSMNWGGGAILVEDRLRFMERRYSSYDGDLAFHIYKQLRTNTVYDFVDHINAIDWRYASGWETLGAPSVYKLPLRHSVYSQDALIAPQFDILVQTSLDYTEAVDTEYDLSVGTTGSSSGYGLDSYGVAPYGAPVTQKVTTNLKRTRCQSYAYVFSHQNIYSSPLITAWETEVAVPFNSGIKK